MLAVASSIQGYSHKKKNIPNQDTFSYLYNNTHQIFVAVVSDGAGSAKNAKLGSSWCCQNITQNLMDIAVSVIERRISISWYIEKIMLAIGNHIDFLSNMEDEIKSFHHTMSAVIFSPMGGKIIQIGDSPVIVITNEDIESDAYTLENSICFDEFKESEYANITTFLTSPNWREKIRVSDLPQNASAIFLMSDGAGSLFVPRKKLHTPAMLEIFRRFKEEEEPLDVILNNFFDMDEVHERTGDDKTLVAYFPRCWIGKAEYSSSYQSHNISEQVLSHASALNINNPILVQNNVSYAPVILDKNAYNNNQIKEQMSTDTDKHVKPET